jgi:LacI family transcriptional regulator
MKDIAKTLGVSVVTVSKVLRNHPDIGEATRERVLKRIKELDYPFSRKWLKLSPTY